MRFWISCVTLPGSLFRASRCRDAGHPVAGQLHAVGRLIVADLVLKQLLLEFLVLDIFLLGFFGKLILVVRLRAELELALRGFLDHLVQQIAHLALAAAEGQELVLVLIFVLVGVNLDGAVVDRLL